MNNPAVDILLKGVLLPISVCAILIVLFSLAPRVLRRCAPAVAIACGYAASHFILHRPSGIPPGDSLDWLPFVAVLAAAGAIVFVLIENRRLLSFLVLAVGVVIGVTLPVLPLFMREPVDIKAAVSVVIGVVALCIGFLAAREERKISWAFLLHVTVVLAGIAILYMMAGSMLLAGLGGALAATAGVVFVANYVFGARWNVLSVILPVLAIEGGLLSYAHNFTSLTAVPAVLILLSFLPGMLLTTKGIERLTHNSRSGAKRVLTALLPTLISAVLLVAGGIIVYRASPEYIF